MATPIPRNRALFALDEIAYLTSGRLRGPGELQVRGVAIDSRQVEPGNLFVALRGASHDAHRFIPDAVQAGAAAVVMRTGAPRPDRSAVVEVEDTERALGELAAARRRRWGGRVVAITGSAGKTTTKELAAEAVEAFGARVHRTPGNLNNLVGLPMTVLALDDSTDVAVLELGTNHPGEIARLSEIAGPDVGVVTLVAAAHTEGLGGIEQVAEEKTALLRALRPRGVAIINGDDPWLVRRAEPLAAEHWLSFGRSEGSDLRLASWEVDSDLRTRCTFIVQSSPRSIQARLRVLGEAAGMNAAAALAVVAAEGGDMEAAAAALEHVLPAPGRMRPVRGERDTLLIDDAYNANPRSTVLALDTAARIALDTKGRLVAVLGDMKELGERSRVEHEEVGAHAVTCGARVLVCCGKAMSDAAHAAGGRGAHVETVEDSAQALEATRRLLRPGDVVLVKGSRSMAMERVVRGLSGAGEVGA